MTRGVPAPGLILDSPQLYRRIDLHPDAVWRDRTQLEVVFKYAPEVPSQAQVASWHRDVWNMGLAPLLWVVCPQHIRLYNTYERPRSTEDASSHLLREVHILDRELSRLDDYAGRLAMASGQFWSHEARVQQEGRVDQQLLRDLRELEEQLCETSLPRDVAQALIGRTIFVRYLIDRDIVTRDTLRELDIDDPRNAISERRQAYRLFDWIRSTFNGDLFPISSSERDFVNNRHLGLVSDTLSGMDPKTGQRSLWEYRFDVIPIDLVSSIYEQFTHSEYDERLEHEGIHYTPLSVVNLALDEVMNDVSAHATVLDITCGSGVFLVEALRRLVSIRSGDMSPSRNVIRDTLHNQIFGVDKSEAAIRVASFSLYLAALELDPDPAPPGALRLDPLIGRNLFIGNAFDFDKLPTGQILAGRKFDVIVGNPPWTYTGMSHQKELGVERKGPPLPPRSRDFAFVWRSIDFAHTETRFGVVMRATPFFSRAESSIRARLALIERLRPIAIVNLSALRDGLFPTADYPAVILFARLRSVIKDDRLPIVTVPWTSTFSRTGAFEIAPSDVRTARLSEIYASPHLLKAVAIGTPRDLLLLRRFEASTITLDYLLDRLDIDITTGIQKLPGDRKDATHLLGLPFLPAGHRTPYIKPSFLRPFDLPEVHRPRTRSAFVGPLVLVGERIANGRPAVSISETDVVFTRSYYGLSFAHWDNNLAVKVGGLLLSALASWHLYLTSSEFGIHKRKLLRQDLNKLPTPSAAVLLSEHSDSIVDAMENLAVANEYDHEALATLDEAVFDVYELKPDERIVILDGLDRAKREYSVHRKEANLPSNPAQLRTYAASFLSAINAWQMALDRQLYGAEIIGLRHNSPLRMIRFFIHGNDEIRFVDADHGLNEILARIGARIRLPIAERLAEVRELRVHAEGELLIIKPVARRYWTPASGLNDADRALGDGI